LRGTKKCRKLGKALGQNWKEVEGNVEGEGDLANQNNSLIKRASLQSSAMYGGLRSNDAEKDRLWRARASIKKQMGNGKILEERK